MDMFKFTQLHETKVGFPVSPRYAGKRLVGPAAALGVSLLVTGVASAQAPDPIEEVTRGLNTSWVLITAFLVFFMQAGFAFVEAGLTRAKNTTNILMKNLMDFVMGTLSYWAIGFGLMFGASNAGLFGTSDFFIGIGGEDIAGVPALAFWLFQLVFAGTAATIVSGAMAERTKFSAYLVYSFIISLLIYPIFGHWVWGSGWLWTLGDSTGLVAEGGFRDFAGSQRGRLGGADRRDRPRPAHRAVWQRWHTTRHPRTFDVAIRVGYLYPMAGLVRL